MTSKEDAADIASVLAGDSRAFEGIVKRWERVILNLAFRSTRRRDLAEDLAQEIFLQIYRALATWRRGSSFSTWIFAVALNHLRSRFRRTRPDLVGLEPHFDLPDPRTVEGPAAEGPRIEALRRAVVGLPAPYREAILLHYFEGQDVHSACLSLGIKEGTFKARLSRARALLGRALAPPRQPTTLRDKA